MISPTLGRDRDQQLDVAQLAGQRLQLFLLGRHLGDPLVLDLGLVGLAAVEIVIDLHRHDLVGRELRAAVLAEQAHRVGAALAAMPHHVHLAFAAVLQRFQFLRRRTTLAGETEHGAMLRRRDQRHDVVQERAARFHRLVDFDQVLVVDARDHDRIDLAQDAALGEHLQALQLAVGEQLRRLDAGIALVLPEHPGINFRADLRIDHVDGDGDVVDVEARDGVDVIGQR